MVFCGTCRAQVQDTGQGLPPNSKGCISSFYPLLFTDIFLQSVSQQFKLEANRRKPHSPSSSSNDPAESPTETTTRMEFKTPQVKEQWEAATSSPFLISPSTQKETEHPLSLQLHWRMEAPYLLMEGWLGVSYLLCCVTWKIEAAV